MSKVDAFETDILELLFNNTALADIGDSTGLPGAGTVGNFYIALFTADPTDTGSVANEATYTGYARDPVPRSTAGWTVSGGEASNAAAITFAACTGGSNDITHFGICKEGTASVADLIYHGALSATRTVSSGITPEFAIGDLTVTEG